MGIFTEALLFSYASAVLRRFMQRVEVSRVRRVLVSSMSLSKAMQVKRQKHSMFDDAIFAVTDAGSTLVAQVDPGRGMNCG